MNLSQFRTILFLSFFFFQNPELSFAIESEAQREAVVTPRTKRFYKSNIPRKYLSFGGSYSSDYNSKTYQLTSRYLYQSRDYIHEIFFDHESAYADSGSSENKESNKKKSELYDFVLSSKARIKEGRNYAVFYNREIYDDLSKYYFDTRTALGLGRMFFKEKLEMDVSLGYHNVKNYGNKVEIITSLRANFKITDRLTFVERAYYFFDHESVDNGFKTSLVYRISDKLSFEVRHNFETRRYEDDKNNQQANLVNRSVIIGIIFDLN